MSDTVTLVIVPLAVAIIGGVVLLLVEYKTKWFANWQRKTDNGNRRDTGVRAYDVKSRRGNIYATDSTGRGVDAERLTAEGDINLSSREPDQSSSSATLLTPAERMFEHFGLSAERMLAGGNITIQQFLNNQLSPTQQLEFFKQQIGIPNVRSTNYVNAQFEAYCSVWKTLQALKYAGDALWRQATTENLAHFAAQWHRTKLTVDEGGIFFEEEHHQSLLHLLKKFGEYNDGKMKVVQIRSQQDAKWGNPDLLRQQIDRNWHYKVEYEQLLEKIRVSFRERLSNPQ
jgi:hypothetical protein